jgi:transcriptional regulator with XRE-family HTH domain
MLIEGGLVTSWTAERVRKLRGQRTQQELGLLIRVPKNTVWRWESGYSTPDAERARRLSLLARKEGFLQDWKLEGSAKLLGDLEEGSRHLAKHLKLSFSRMKRAVV